MPSRRDGRACLVAFAGYAVFFTAFFWQSLTTGELIAPSDALDFGVAGYQAAPSLWTQGLYSGYPIAADPQSLIFSPPFFLLGITAFVAIAVIRVYFNVPFHGSVSLIVISSALCLLCGIGIGTVVATLTKSAQQAQLTTFFISPPLMSLSGAMTPAEAMPEWLRPWTAVNPVYHFGVITRASLIKGSGFADLWDHVLALAVFALVLVSISVWRFRKQLAS